MPQMLLDRAKIATRSAQQLDAARMAEGMRMEPGETAGKQPLRRGLVSWIAWRPVVAHRPLPKLASVARRTPIEFVCKLRAARS